MAERPIMLRILDQQAALLRAEMDDVVEEADERIEVIADRLVANADARETEKRRLRAEVGLR